MEEISEEHGEERAHVHMKGCYSMERTGGFCLAVCAVLPFWILCTILDDILPRDI